MRILIIKPSSLGDVIHALPTVNLIRRKYPHAHISWLVNDTLTSLLQHCPIIDEIIPFERRRFGSLAQLPAFGKFLATLKMRQFDIAVDLQGLLRSGIISWATRAPRRIGLSDAARREIVLQRNRQGSARACRGPVSPDWAAPGLRLRSRRISSRGVPHGDIRRPDCCEPVRPFGNKAVGAMTSSPNSSVASPPSASC